MAKKKSWIVIADELLGNYVIKYDGTSFAVVKIGTRQKLEGGTEPKEVVYGYYPTLFMAVNGVISQLWLEQAESVNERIKYLSLVSYLKEYKKMYESLHAALQLPGDRTPPKLELKLPGKQE